MCMYISVYKVYYVGVLFIFDHVLYVRHSQKIINAMQKKMSEKDSKCASLFPKAQGGIVITCLANSPKSKNINLPSK